MNHPIEFEVIRSNRRTMAAEIRKGRLTVRAPANAADTEIRAFLEKNREWIETRLAKAQARQQVLADIPRLTAEELRLLTRRAGEYLPGRVRYYAPLIGVTCGRITVRHQKTRWGSCSSKGNLNFNCLLMLAPPEVIDSVVVHELCHLKFMNHSDRFYAEVLKVFPEYRKCSRWLKENGDLLLCRADL